MTIQQWIGAAGGALLLLYISVAITRSIRSALDGRTARLRQARKA